MNSSSRHSTSRSPDQSKLASKNSLISSSVSGSTEPSSDGALKWRFRLVRPLFFFGFHCLVARMPLLRMDLLVGLENLVDHRNERPELRLGPGILLRLLRRFRVLQNLLDRPKVQIVLSARFSPAHLPNENIAANPRPYVHVSKHSFPSRS